MIEIDYKNDCGLIKQGSAIYCMYGESKSYHLGTAQCLINGKVYVFNPVVILKAYPETRTNKSIKAAAAYIVIHEKGYKPGMQIKNWAQHSLKGTRMSRPPTIPRFK